MRRKRRRRRRRRRRGDEGEGEVEGEGEWGGREGVGKEGGSRKGRMIHVNG